MVEWWDTDPLVAELSNDDNYDAQKVERVAELIHKTKSVIYQNRLSDSGFRVLCEVLKNASLRLLSINYDTDDDRVKMLCAALKENRSITDLSLSGSNIRDEGAKVISTVLQGNNNLTRLHLHDNKIGDAGAAAISEALRTNTTLNCLDLGDNEIGNDGASAISRALKENDSLSTLYLRGNPFGDIGAKAISEALESNKSITNLTINNKNYEKEISDKIQENKSRSLFRVKYSEIMQPKEDEKKRN